MTGSASHRGLVRPLTAATRELGRLPGPPRAGGGPRTLRAGLDVIAVGPSGPAAATAPERVSAPGGGRRCARIGKPNRQRGAQALTKRRVAPVALARHSVGATTQGGWPECGARRSTGRRRRGRRWRLAAGRRLARSAVPPAGRPRQRSEQGVPTASSHHRGRPAARDSLALSRRGSSCLEMQAVPSLGLRRRGSQRLRGGRRRGDLRR